MKKFISQNFNIEILVLIIISFIPLFWFQKDHVILGLDTGYAIDHIKFFLLRTQTWMPNPNFGVDMSAEMGLLPLVVLPAIISYIGVSIFDVQKFLLVGWFFILAISTYAFFREVFDKKDQWIIRLTATFIYIFNFHLYAFWLQGEQPMLASYVILPLSMLLLLRFVRRKAGVFMTALLLSIVYLFFSSGGIRGIPLIGPVILGSLSIFSYFGLLNWKTEGFSYIKRFFFLFVLFVLFSLPLNAYWILPFITSFSHEFNSQVTIAGGIEGAISWARFVSGKDSFANLFRLQGDNNWYYFPFLWSNNFLTNPILILASFIFPFLAFLAPVFAKIKEDKKIILYFTALALVSLFFAAGTHPPFGEIYASMMRYIPGFATFRSAYYKFMPTVYFAFAPLIGFTIYSISQKVGKKQKVILGVISLTIILLYNYPFFQNTNAVFNKPFTTMVKIPDYVLDFQEMINTSQISDKTLVLPQTNKAATIKAYKWGYYGAFSIFALMTDKPFVQYDAYLFNDSANSLIDTIYSKLRGGDLEGFRRITSAIGIQYVILTRDIVANYSSIPLERPEVYQKILSDKKYFTQIWSRGEWTMYKINGKVQKPINVLSDISVVSPDSSGLTSYFNEFSNSFVLANQINSSLLSKLNKRAEISNFPCASCALLEKVDLPKIPFSNVTPDSFLYPFKLKNDKVTLEKTPSDRRVNYALGLSTKRVSEFVSLTQGSLGPQSSPLWITAAKLTQQYWDIIDKSLSDLPSPNYSIYANIHRHATAQLTELRKVVEKIEVINSPELLDELSGAILKIEKVDLQLQAIIGEKDWTRNFNYVVPKNLDFNALKLSSQSFYSPIISLERDTPSFEKVKNTPYMKEVDTKIVSVQIPDEPNLLGESTVREIPMLHGKKQCLVYPVNNYSWQKKYILSFISGDNLVPKTVFVGMKRNHFATQDTVRPSQHIFTPDFTVNPKNESGYEDSLEFTGKQNDLNASVYFCTDPGFDPYSGFKNMYLRTLFVPDLYTIKNVLPNNTKAPKMEYKKISSSKYIVNIKEATSPYILSYLETSTPNWKLYIDKKEQMDKFMINGFANAWYITKKGNYQIVLEFYPERAFLTGVMISFTSFVMVVLYLIYRRIKRKL